MSWQRPAIVDMPDDFEPANDNPRMGPIWRSKFAFVVYGEIGALLVSLALGYGIFKLAEWLA